MDIGVDGRTKFDDEFGGSEQWGRGSGVFVHSERREVGLGSLIVGHGH